MSIVYIARCPEHGLHGQRQECFECGGPVEQVAMVPAVSGDTEGLVAEAQKALEGITPGPWLSVYRLSESDSRFIAAAPSLVSRLASALSEKEEELRHVKEGLIHNLERCDEEHGDAEARLSVLQEAAEAVLRDNDEFPWEAGGFNDDEVFERLTTNQERLRALLEQNTPSQPTPPPPRPKINRILWNRRPRGRDLGEIDEVVIHDALVHVEQMDDGNWWIGVYKDDGQGNIGQSWSGNFFSRSKNVMTSTEQDCDIKWDADESHEPSPPTPKGTA